MASLKVEYRLSIDNPEGHYLKVAVTGQAPKGCEELEVFLPSWSPGSYLMREYARNLRRFQACAANGEALWFAKRSKGTWAIALPQEGDGRFEITFEVYCHELSVRTSHMDASHAFIHGPAVLPGFVGLEVKDPILRVSFPPAWSKVATALVDVSTKREEFVYSAADYDELIDAPLEIGCHHSDGFTLAGVDHELAFFGAHLAGQKDLKGDIRKICATVAKVFGDDLPFAKYTLIAHFVPGKYGGLEHNSSAAVHFCPFKLATREGYLNWLGLVAHEYFHAWNGKRIRPKELGPFDYRQEATGTMLWLVEGLTSFMDDLFVLRAGLCSLEEYLKVLCKNFGRYLEIPGRLFDSLEDSSFDAWIKLYRPGENSDNATVSYYLKGGLVFWILSVRLTYANSSVDELLRALWKRYRADPAVGLVREEVFAMVEKLGGRAIAEEFSQMIRTTEELPFEEALQSAGLDIRWEQEGKAWLGARLASKEGRIQVEKVTQDGPAWRAGLNAGDELLAVDGLRLAGVDLSWGKPEGRHTLTVSRQGRLMEIPLMLGKTPRIPGEIQVANMARIRKVLGLSAETK